MNNVMVFDTETTGLPIDWKAPVTDLDNWPRVIQLAWAVYTLDGSIIKEYKTLIKPDNWSVPAGQFWIDHGYSTEKCEAAGLPLPVVIDAFLEDMATAGILVVHNMSFDNKVLGAEMIRYGKRSEARPTKVVGTNVCKITNRFGSYKWPTLAELHQFLFDADFDGAHDAGFDVAACGKCFFELMSRGHIQ